MRYLSISVTSSYCYSLVVSLGSISTSGSRQPGQYSLQQSQQPANTEAYKPSNLAPIMLLSELLSVYKNILCSLYFVHSVYQHLQV